MNQTLQQQLNDPGLLALAVPADQIARRDKAPEGFLALCVAGEELGGVRRAGEKLDAAAGQVLFVRDCPWGVDLPTVELASKDRLRAQCWVAMQVRPRPEPAELASLLRQVLNGRPRLDDAVLAEWLSGPAVASLRALASGVALKELIELTTAEQLAAQLAERLAAPLFRGGLQLAGVVGLSFTSDDYDAQRQAERHAALAEDITRLEEQVSQARHQTRSAELDRLADVLGKLDELGSKLGNEKDPAARARRLGDLLARFDAADREAFAAGSLLMDEPDAEASAVVPLTLLAAGRELWRLTDESDDVTQLAGVDAATDVVGPLRSIASADGWLLAGGRDGLARLVLTADGAGVEVEAIYEIPASPSIERRRRGINSAALVGDAIFATHGEVGLIRWPTDGSAGEVVLSAGQGQYLRAVVPGDEGTLLLGRDDALVRLAPGGEPEVLLATAGPVSAIARDLAGWWIGDETGRLWEFNGTTGREVARFGGAIGSIQPVLVGCLNRLLLAAGAGGLVLHQPQINASTQLPSGSARIAGHADGWTIALAGRRDRVLLWSPGQTAKPTTDLPLYARVGHSIQDLAVVGV